MEKIIISGQKNKINQKLKFDNTEHISKINKSSHTILIDNQSNIDVNN